MALSKPLSILWHVIMALITVGIALAVLGSAESRFETVVVALLVMLYTHIRTNALIAHKHFVATSKAQLSQCNELAALLKHPQIDEFRERHRQHADVDTTPTLIEGVALGIIWFAALLAILMKL